MNNADNKNLILTVDSDLEWKLIYVGSGSSKEHDQVLDTVSVGPVKAGINQFVLKCAAPKPNLIPKEDIVGSTALLLTCAYKDNEFVRIGYFANNEYIDEELRNNPPATPQIEKIERNIAADQPRITTYAIDWK